MKALVKSKAEKGLWLEDQSVPQIGSHDLLVKIHKTAICGTDLHIFQWDEWAQETIPVPLTVGHEFCGEVAQIGSEVRGFKVGDRISGEGHVTCGHCRNCRAGKRHLCRNTDGIGIHRAGAFAEYLCLPASNAFVLPDEITDDIASFLDPLGNATHTALSFDVVGEDVLITGAGPIGCMAAAICKHIGCRFVVVSDVNDYRLAIARDMGVDLAVNVKERTIASAQEELGMLEGFDVGLEMSGNPTAFRDLLDNMNHGGHVALLGLPPPDVAIDWNLVIFRGLTLKGIYGREMFETWYKMGTMLQSGLDVSRVLTHQFPAERFQEAFDTIRAGQCGKVVLDWLA